MSIKSKLTLEIEQQRRIVEEKQAAYNEARASVGALLKEIKSLDKAGKLTGKAGLQYKDKLSYANVKAKALSKQAQDVIAAQNKLLDLQNAAIRDQLEKQHGLLAYGIATGSLGPEAHLLHATIGDYLNAKTEADKEAAQRSAKLIWAHGTVIATRSPKS